VHGHLQEAGEIRQRSAHAEGETMMPICSIDEYANIRLMSRRRLQHEGGEDQRDSPIVTINAQVRWPREFAAAAS